MKRPPAGVAADHPLIEHLKVLVVRVWRLAGLRPSARHARPIVPPPVTRSGACCAPNKRIVIPILRWYRQLVAQKYDGSRKRGPGRPRTRIDIAALIVRMANENPRWGYTRIRGALGVLGMFVGRSSIQRVLADHGIEPAPERSKHMRWSTFLHAHWGAIAAADFFSVEVLTVSGLVRHFVLFVIDLKSRRVEIAAIVHPPHEAWMKQVARNLTDAVEGFLCSKWKLIHDRDPLFSAGFRATLGSAVTTIKLPVKSPNLNAFAERFGLSRRSSHVLTPRCMKTSDVRNWRAIR